MPEADETGDVLMILSGVLGHREGSKVRKTAIPVDVTAIAVDVDTIASVRHVRSP